MKEFNNLRMIATLMTVIPIYANTIGITTPVNFVLLGEIGPEVDGTYHTHTWMKIFDFRQQ